MAVININKFRMRLWDYNGLLLKRIFIYLCQETIVRVCKSNVSVMVLLLLVLVSSNGKQNWSTNRNTNIITVGLRASDVGVQSVLLLVLALLLVLVTAGLCSWYPDQTVFIIEILILVIVRPEQRYLEGTMVNNNKSKLVNLHYCTHWY